MVNGIHGFFGQAASDSGEGGMIGSKFIQGGEVGENKA